MPHYLIKFRKKGSSEDIPMKVPAKDKAEADKIAKAVADLPDNIRAKVVGQYAE